jgi:hypothetical protein
VIAITLGTSSFLGTLSQKLITASTAAASGRGISLPEIR